MRYIKTIMITGATAGIGEATAHQFAQIGCRVIITGRRTERLSQLKAVINEKHAESCYTLCFDVRDRAAVQQAVQTLPQDWRNIDVLVNNAGLAKGKESIDEGLYTDWDEMIDTNVKGLLYITEAILPLMKSGSHIVNISSIAGLQSYPGGNVYCASKHAVEGLSNGMRIDLLKRNIKVTSICPGLVETEFSMVRYKGDKAKADATYEGIHQLTAGDVADAIVWSVMRPKNVHITQILMMAQEQADANYVHRKAEV